MQEQSNLKKKVEEQIEQMYKNSTRRLRLNFCHFWNEIMLARNWSMLRVLDIQYNKIGDNGLKVILSRAKFLKKLIIFFCGITKNGMKLFTQINQLACTRNLRALYLGSNVIGAIGVKWLVKSDLLNLIQLRIDHCQINSQGCKNLIKGNWSQYVSCGYVTLILYEAHNNINLQGLQELSQNNFQKLKQLAIVQQPIHYFMFVNLKSEQIIVNGFYDTDNLQLKELLKNILGARNMIK